MNLLNNRHAIVFQVLFQLRSPLMIMTGDGDEISDNTIDKTRDGKLHINGYVWSSLLRRALSRLSGGEEFAQKIGKYPATDGVSPLWCESSFEPLPQCDRHPGIVISRKWGAATSGLLYSEENAPTGLLITLHFIWFPGESFDPDTDCSYISNRFAQAFWVIDRGIENIGAGWSYGYGRLKFIHAHTRCLDLSKPENRKILFRGHFDAMDTSNQELKLPDAVPAISRPWKTLLISFFIPPGQLLAIHSKIPMLDVDVLSEKAPDSFVFRRLVYKSEEKSIFPSIVIPGKAIRQALFSTQIERRLRSKGIDICDISKDSSIRDDAGQEKACTCERCLWFGSADASGILAVLDAPVINFDTEVLHRLAVCEHSFQNIPQKLFSGEYLTRGSFTTEIILDLARPNTHPDHLEKYLKCLLDEMKPGNGPAGWHRIGATSTCTGQLQIKDIQEVCYGGGHVNE